ncbi:alanine racemase [Mesorhizobium sp. M7A.F.Ca.CA.001.07.2.1]|uniref:alanine racemase n=5 Tax=Phyllobacteriaceae TaxID=69277 RepID=UPI000FCA0B99|nr:MULTISPECIES: alanine racemase [Mesorhizobium]RWO73066.1 MAG: alanine racemase [Mesorhizobium sp.]AZV19528.1 alanine racemase [Mesorhizobium sp. M7A.F.Ce.TU.012.03.2.1]MCF6125669.1 alanine racemase [Mesorhizobium ciceri]MCQ8816170.1 alanine racemase [Mesorhizobium sp. SEMIA396]RUX68819.1 alanine racemase [Mesorhizobium sp. M7A.F.Ca.CA.004.08.2.1]
MNDAPQKSPPEEVTATSEVAAGAILTIDLGAIRENYRRLKARLGDVACAGVLKADGYGVGAGQVAAALLRDGCDIFFVALLGEGVALRHSLGPGPAIFVLNGIPPGAEPDAVAANLCAVINSPEQLAAWRVTARRAGRKLQAAIQVDSGMSRLGMAPRDVDRIAADPQAFDGIDIRYVMSHLACADEPEHPANEKQRLAFERLRKMLPEAPASLTNSSGIFLGERFHYDLARPGAALYGINPTPAKSNPMLPVVRLQAKVAQTRSVEKGAGVGYGHTYHAQGPLRLATISFGYADGWQRRAASAAWFEGVRLPFLGRVSMDSIILDISALPVGRLREGDLVELLGPSQSVDDAAGHAGTIGYEILTSLGPRFHRRYVGG